MKVYKKSALLLGMAILSGGTITAFQEWEPTVEWPRPKTEEELKRLVPGTRMHQSKAEISNEMMIAHQKLFTEPEHWIDALTDLNTYVKENAPRNDVLKNAAAKVREVGIRLPQIVQFGGDLLSDRDKLQKTAAALKAEPLWGWGAEKRKDAREVLEVVIKLLMKTINNQMGTSF